MPKYKIARKTTIVSAINIINERFVAGKGDPCWVEFQAKGWVKWSSSHALFLSQNTADLSQAKYSVNSGLKLTM